MKKLCFVFIMLFITLFSFSQKITYKVNDMTDKYSYTFHTSVDSTSCFVSEDNITGFVMSVGFREDANKKLATSLTFNTIYVYFSIKGMECVEHGNLIIKFVDGTKITLNSFNDFNCKNYFFFSVIPKEKLILSSTPIDKIMLFDFRSGITYTFSPDNPKFFIELNQAIGMPYVKDTVY